MTPNPNWQVTKPLILHSSWPSASLFFHKLAACFLLLLEAHSILEHKRSANDLKIIMKAQESTWTDLPQDHSKSQDSSPEQASDSRFERKLSRLSSVQTQKPFLSSTKMSLGRLLCKIHFYEPHDKYTFE